jgi:hypothetical protein
MFRKLLDMIYQSYFFKIIESTLIACPATSLSGSADASGGFGTRRVSVKQSWQSASGQEQATISRIENGKHEPCLRFIELLAMGLKTPMEELFKDL